MIYYDFLKLFIANYLLQAPSKTFFFFFATGHDMWDLSSRPGIEPMPPAMEVLTTGPSEKPPQTNFDLPKSLGPAQLS